MVVDIILKLETGYTVSGQKTNPPADEYQLAVETYLYDLRHRINKVDSEDKRLRDLPPSVYITKAEEVAALKEEADALRSRLNDALQEIGNLKNQLDADKHKPMTPEELIQETTNTLERIYGAAKLFDEYDADDTRI